MRIDKWLWTVRLFKTRSLATDACKGGKIKIEGHVLKPSKELKIGDIITIQMGIYIKTVKVLSFSNNRVNAKLLPELLLDITPEAEYHKLKMQQEAHKNLRPKGLGRPTKKERRTLDNWEWDM